jgi:predicted molibdopterin-dependent oxidoreductase YjgC
MSILKQNRKFYFKIQFNSILPALVIYSILPDQTVVFNYFLPYTHVVQAFQYTTNIENISFILPGCAHVEKSAMYLKNTGATQKSLKIFQSLGIAKTDWRILAAFISLFSLELFLDKKNKIVNNLLEKPTLMRKINTEFLEKKSIIFNSPLVYWITDFYNNNSLGSLSKVLSTSKQLLEAENCL